ncbi:MAG: hypothetical protein VYA39_00250 [Candidatus Thermoplasmatota archaeon]|nr:hypothetical protein [Candidatus Thermoplasmatota archaeon]
MLADALRGDIGQNDASSARGGVALSDNDPYADDDIWGKRDRLVAPKEFRTYSEMREGIGSDSCNECGDRGIHEVSEVGESRQSTFGDGHGDGAELRIVIFRCDTCMIERGRWEELVASHAVDSIEDYSADLPRDDDDASLYEELFTAGSESSDGDLDRLSIYDETRQSGDENRSRNKSTHSTGPRIEIKRKCYVPGDILCRMSPRKRRANIVTTDEVKEGDKVRVKLSGPDGEILDPYSGDFPWPGEFKSQAGEVIKDHGERTIVVRFRKGDNDYDIEVERNNLTITTREIESLKRGRAKIGSSGWEHPQFPEFKARSMASDFLDSGGGKVGRELQRVFPETDWQAEVTGAIWGANVNRRRLEKKEGKVKMEAHGRTRWCLETYVSMTCKGVSFWFFSDFVSKFMVHEEHVDKHLSEGHPFNRLLILGGVEERNRDINRGDDLSPKKIDGSQLISLLGALSRQFGFDPWTDFGDLPIEEIPDDIWDKIELRGKSDLEGVGLRYWVPYEDEERSEKDGEIWVNGGLRKQGLLHLSHIPLAYIIAQMIYDEGPSRGIGKYLHIARGILEMIYSDLDWCEADRASMDVWWEGIIATRDGGADSSVTRIGH